MFRFCFGLMAICFISSCKNDTGSKDKNIDTIDSGLHIVDNIKQTINKYPDSLSLKVHLIDMLDSLKHYDDAIVHIDCLIIKDRFNSNLWLRKGQLLREKGDTIKAIDAFNHSISVYPSPDVLLELANLYAEKKNPRVLVICDNLKKMGLGQTNDSYASFFQGVYYSRTHNMLKAQQLFDQAINDNYTFADPYLEKGYLFYDAKQYDEALKIFQKLSVINNTNANAYYWIAKTEEAKNNIAEALISYQKAYGLDKTMLEAKTSMERLSK